MKFPPRKNGMRPLSRLEFPKVYENLLRTAKVMLLVFLATYFCDTGQTAAIYYNEKETRLPFISGESSKYEKVASARLKSNLGTFQRDNLTTFEHRFLDGVSSKRRSRRTEHRYMYPGQAWKQWRGVSRRNIFRRKRENRERTKQSETVVESWPHWCNVKRYDSKKVILQCNPHPYGFFYIAKNPRFPHVYNASDSGGNNSSKLTQDLRQLYALHNAVEQYGTPTDVTDLRLWFQGIIFVESYAFKNLNRLKSLKLQNNKISYISKEAFQGLTELTELDLSYNRLQSIPSNVFQPLSKLEILRLENNEVSYIQNGMFCGLRSLVDLDLSHNAIGDIAPHALRHFRSKYTVFIKLGYNNLKRPRNEWLQCFEEDVDPLCVDEKVVNRNLQLGAVTKIDNVTLDLASVDPNIKANSDSMAGRQSRIIDDKSNEGNHSCSASVREFRATHNPWSCSCNTSFHLLEFLELYNTIVTSQFSRKIGEDETEIRYNEHNATIILPKEHSTTNFTNKLYYSNYYKWHFTMPCATPTQLSGLDLGETSPSEEQRKRLRDSCCNELAGSEDGREFIEGDRIAGRFCGGKIQQKDFGLSDNEVTIIGIVIVFVTPILLTLCPDCDREIVPSSGAGVMSAGKFGAMSSNYNNNYNNNKVCPDSHEMVRTSKTGSFFNPRTCRKSRSHSPEPQYSEEIV